MPRGVWSMCVLLFSMTLSLREPRADLSDQELFWGEDQYDFSIVLRASDLQCFWHFAHYGERFYLNFMVQLVTGVALGSDLSVIVNAPSGLIVGRADDASGQISFSVQETGEMPSGIQEKNARFYQMCLSNFHNRFGSMQVSLDFGVYYEGKEKSERAKEEVKRKKEEDKKEINSTLIFIGALSHESLVLQESTVRLQRALFHMVRHYNLERMRRGADFYLLQSNSTYVWRWSASQSLMILCAGVLQLHLLKRLFRSREAPSQTDGARAQC
ncbi:hypothetical protein DNTS_011867 [Danionella cerebrum]|uniref:GOLD domain-containing protein n=1 Tax=Danionella cerebrum TaxID=2873325 RepID=A0A553Q7C1_9TELE|nr:hypothetical protein DNTS_011867 [Danionella translucida]